MEQEEEVPLAVEFNRRKKWKTIRSKKAHGKDITASDGGGSGGGEGFSVPNDENGRNEVEFSPRISVSEFDGSVENHFRAVDTISRLCGESEDDFDPSEICRLSSSITFWRDWKQFCCYPSRVLRFTCQNQNREGKDFVGAVSLPQFSSAIVPKKHVCIGEETFSESSKDFAMHVGGLVSALDWCPRVHSHSNVDIRSEFIAVAAHPPESSYHKMGEPVTGQGIVQVWCVVSTTMRKGVSSQNPKRRKKTYRNNEGAMTNSSEQMRPQGTPRKHPVDSIKLSKEPKPRGRPRKTPLTESNIVQAPAVPPSLVANVKSSKELKPRRKPRKAPLTECKIVQVPAVPPSLDANVKSSKERKPRRKPRKTHLIESKIVLTPVLPPFKDSSTLFNLDMVSESTLRLVSEEDSVAVQEEPERVSVDADLPLSCLDKTAELPFLDSQTLVHLGPDTMSCDSGLAKCSIPEDVALPRMVLCLAHDGKVSWDVKWRPFGVCGKQRMGYLAVLLGNGALEIWEVPFPRTVKVIYSASQKDPTDPRFMRLEPVFRCSRINCGDRQSIPLTLEWSSSYPHDTVLAGCHDGVVALWKFTGSGSLEDTRPLLCFSADTVPIRALSWAPVERLSESSNVIVTAGHKGLKFWDLRDPFRPLWDFYTVQRIIYGLDWLPDPRCIIASFDDGTLRILSLAKAAYDVPATGKPFLGTQQQGFHSYYCSQFPIWSVHSSQQSGMVAYCSSDGTALCFQLTTREVERDRVRNRAPHFLCGSLTQEDLTLTMYTPLPNIPFPMKKSLNEWAEAPRTIRGFSSYSNQKKRALEKMENVQTFDVQPPALCYGSDVGVEFRSDDAVVVPTDKRDTKRKSSSKKKLKDGEQLLICGDDNPDICGEQQPSSVTCGVQNGAIEEFEVFPPKTVAMHRVRWNKNVGSENWLCYGGAAGVLRCQLLATNEARDLRVNELIQKCRRMVCDWLRYGRH